MKTKKKKAGLIIILSVIIILIAADWIFSVFIFEQNFGQRFQTYEPTMFRLEDFEGLERTQYKFPSDKRQMLTGYLYTSGTEQHGIVIIAHGFGGGGHNSYMDCADYFAKHGYYVFAYDATGCDESEGDKVGSLAQGAADLEYAVSFVENGGDFPFSGKDMPICLFGHSWGGYCVSAVLSSHPEVKAVIECSGFDSSSDMFESEGKNQAGGAIYLMLPFVELHDRIHYGKYASMTASDGMAATDAAIMIVHSQDDTVVPIEYGYDKFYAKYGSDPRFTFMHYDDKGHNGIFNDNTYYNELSSSYSQWRSSLDYDIGAPENEERFRNDKADFYRDNLDRRRWADRLDKEMFDMFVRFYDENIG